mmetsp:Transcript_91557/g.296420  ORF Transcript_91557/g.296420 Transcript_91557/m.296420 type:complete len:358 (+) Transcript_91557:164-1237(+)
MAAAEVAVRAAASAAMPSLAPATWVRRSRRRSFCTLPPPPTRPACAGDPLCSNDAGECAGGCTARTPGREEEFRPGPHAEKTTRGGGAAVGQRGFTAPASRQRNSLCGSVCISHFRNALEGGTSRARVAALGAQGRRSSRPTAETWQPRAVPAQTRRWPCVRCGEGLAADRGAGGRLPATLPDALLHRGPPHAVRAPGLRGQHIQLPGRPRLDCAHAELLRRRHRDAGRAARALHPSHRRLCAPPVLRVAANSALDGHGMRLRRCSHLPEHCGRCFQIDGPGRNGRGSTARLRLRGRLGVHPALLRFARIRSLHVGLAVLQGLPGSRHLPSERAQHSRSQRCLTAGVSLRSGGRCIA